MLIVSDTSPISNLHVIGKLDLLYEVFGDVILPSIVFYELSKLKTFGYDISSIEQSPWISIKSAENLIAVSRLSAQLDPGESEAIVLSMELHADYLLIDERRGWKIANSLGIKTVGTLGVLLQAKSKGLLPQVATVLDELESLAGFWMSAALRKEVLLLAGEQI